MEGYSVTEAASVLGVPTERVWELLARGVLSGAPEGETGMRVFLQPRPAPRAVIEEPRAGNGDATPRQPEIEPSPFRELLTEFRNLTERYGQALLALGEARGEVASLRSRVDLLEARFDLRLPMSGVPRPGAEWGPRAVVEPSAAGRPEDAHEHEAEEPPRRKRSRGQRRATDEFAEALARAEDPTPAELPGAADAAAAFAALRDESVSSLAGDEELEASLPRDLPAAEPIATLELEPGAAVEPARALAPEPVPEPQPEPVAAEAEPAEATIADDRDAAAGTVVRFEAASEPEPDVEAVLDVEPVSSAVADLEPEPVAAWDAPADVEREPDEAWAASPGEEPTADEQPIDEASPSWSTSIRDQVEPAPSTDADVAGIRREEAIPEVQPAAADERTTDEPSWDRQRYTTDIEEHDWIPEEPAPEQWSARPAIDTQPTPSGDATSDRIESEAFGWGQEETERWFASGQELPSMTEEAIEEDRPVQEAEAPIEEAAEPEPAPIEDPADEMEVAGARGHAGPAGPPAEVDQQTVEPAAPAPWAPAPSPPPAWAERFPSPGPSPTPTDEAGTASRAYRRLRRIFPG